MSYIINNTSPFVSIKLTEKGREKLSMGQLNFSYWGIGDSEINYTREEIVDNNQSDITLSASSKIMRPFDRQPNIKYFITPETATTPFNVLNTSNINVIKAVVNNEANERGFFSYSGSDFTTITATTFTPYQEVIANTQLTGGTTLSIATTMSYSLCFVKERHSINYLIYNFKYLFI